MTTLNQSIDSRRLLVLDNYDSFTYNLVQYLEYLMGRAPEVIRNDAMELEEVDRFDAIVLSPGPGLPSKAGIMPELIQRYAPSKAILGVCLGHQAIGEAFGGSLQNLDRVFHGVETSIEVTDPGEDLFQGIPANFSAGRYHSWVVAPHGIPAAFQVTAIDANNQIMAMRHRQYNLRGVQFHPESVMTPDGIQMLANWLQLSVGLAVRSEFENPTTLLQS